MDVRNCRTCGRLFNYIGGGSQNCPVCDKKMDEKFSIVKTYIYDNPRVGMQEVAEENDVSIHQIKKWVREERLCFSDDSPVGLECESCGGMIKTGRFCQQCKDKMATNLGSIYKGPDQQVQKKNQPTSPKMRFFDK